MPCETLEYYMYYAWKKQKKTCLICFLVTFMQYIIEKLTCWGRWWSGCETPVAPKTPVAAPSAPEIPLQAGTFSWKNPSTRSPRDTCNRSAGSGNPATLSVGFKKKKRRPESGERTKKAQKKVSLCETCETKTGTRGLGGGAAPPSRRLWSSWRKQGVLKNQ